MWLSIRKSYLLSGVSVFFSCCTMLPCSRHDILGRLSDIREKVFKPFFCCWILNERRKFLCDCFRFNLCWTYLNFVKMFSCFVVSNNAPEQACCSMCRLFANSTHVDIFHSINYHYIFTRSMCNFTLKLSSPSGAHKSWNLEVCCYAFIVTTCSLLEACYHHWL